MAAPWPAGVPQRLLRAGSAYRSPETVIRSATDSGKARQRQVFTATDKAFQGSIRMTQDQLQSFIAWRDALGGNLFDWVDPFTGATVTARFIAGEQGMPAPDSQTPKWLIPVVIEIVS